ncbi:PAS domain S-box protein [Asinibacterium sp. OR53]|uniref:sensor histidine kinase n=1 Tax=Asinibacterium sp. OR53 TaxID=925409 RepID=UPI0018DDF842|nr:PAS domain S-box protein [Asinibacterium sp. OR53]
MQAPILVMDIAKNDFLITLCNSIKEGAAIVEKDTTKIVFCNAAWLKLFDFDASAEIDMTQVDQRRIIKLTDAEIENRIVTLEREGFFCEQTEYISKNGRSFWGELSIRPFKNKERIYYIVVIDKIDSVKETERMIAQDKQRFDALLEYASMGIIETNSYGEIININLFALMLFGYSKEEILKKKIELLIPTRYHSKHLHHRGHYIAHPKNRPMGVGMDLFAVKKDGTEFPVEVSLSSYIRDNEQCIIAFVSDISIRKKSETEIKNLNDELEGKIEQRTKELKTAIQQLELSKEELSKLLEKEKELNELKSRFVSMASHEFRTPLSTILSSVYLLEQYNNNNDQAKRDRHLKRIISSANMLTDILNDFLSVDKIEEGKINVKYTEFDIQHLIVSVTDEIKNTLKKGQVINYVHDGHSMVFLDPTLLKHIIMNLVSNAGKFSPEASLIRIKTYSDEDRFIFSITDQGIGISKDDQKHLMERFFRGNNVTGIQGTGLGLHIVSKYAELMNGSVECKSELLEGTEFIITFNEKTNRYEKDINH